MKANRFNTLVFQQAVFFAVILLGVLLLILTSGHMTQRERAASEAIDALTMPYTRIYTGLDTLRGSKSGVLGADDAADTGAESAGIIAGMREAVGSLKALLNDGDYNRSSVELDNTLESYQSIYEDVLACYTRRDYPRMNLAIERLDQAERWIRGYLAETGAAIALRQEALRGETSRRRAEYYRTMLILGSLIFLLCIVTQLLSYLRFVRPIEELCRNVRAFRLSDSAEALRERGVPCRPHSIREVRTLATAIYSMQDTVLGQYAVEKHNEQLKQKLVAEAMHTAQVERRLQEAQLKALQAQINPHFLFNTLNMIGQMAYLEGAERTTDLLDTFSRFFRYNVESFERNVTIAEEIENVRGYVALQRERFGDRIRYQIDADRAVEAVRVPSLIVQPLVENALSHGLRMRTGGGEVDVSVRALEAGGFVIRVSDNGCGMDAEALRALRARVDGSESEDRAEHRSIGLSNVVSRMRLTFGGRFRCDLESAPDGGFSVSLRVEGGMDP